MRLGIIPFCDANRRITWFSFFLPPDSWPWKPPPIHHRLQETLSDAFSSFSAIRALPLSTRWNGLGLGVRFISQMEPQHHSPSTKYIEFLRADMDSANPDWFIVNVWSVSCLNWNHLLALAKEVSLRGHRKPNPTVPFKKLFVHGGYLNYL